MKKIFYFILAAAAIVASCAKEPISEPVSPSGDGSSVFTGTIIQPGGIDEATKVSIIAQTTEVDKVYIKWTSGDQIHIIKRGSEEWNSTSESNKPKVFYAASSEATTQFTGNPPTDWIAPGATYEARYYGKEDVWKEYVLAGEPVEGITINCNSSNAEAAFLENMPLSCGQSSYDASNFRYNFTFSNAYAILQINVPSKLDFKDLYVCVNAQNVEFESGQLTDGSKYTLCLKNADAVKSTEKYTNKDRVTYFVPVSAGNYSKLTIVAAKGNAEVARMETYEGNVKNTSDSPYALPQLSSNSIYPFDFCNTKTIETAGEYQLESNNGIDYKVNIAADITSDVTIKAEVEGKEPANIYINNRGHQISGKLTINASKSHVEGENGIATTVEAKTSNSTFVVKPSLTITGLTVKKGSVKVEGKDNKTANVTNITIPAGVTEQIKIDVSGVSSNDENGRVKIVNNSETPVVVVPDNVDNQKSYKVEQGPVTPVSKDIVAMIGTIGYETLKAAVDAVTVDNQSTVTIKVIKDIVLKKADALNINKNKVVLDGQGHTIALDETDPELAKYLVTSSDNDSRKYGRFHMIDVSGNGVTLKNLTLDSKNYRGASLATTVGGNNVVYENIVYNGKGSAHYYSTNNNGLITFKNCKINTCGYGVHSDTAADGIVIEGCEIHGWNAFGAAVKNVSLNNSKFYSSEDYYNGTLAAFSIYCPTTFTKCTFSKEFTQAGSYEGIFMSQKALVSMNECSVAESELYQMVRIDDKDWAAGSVIAIDATGDATDGFTAGTFVAKQASDIKAAASYEVKAVEGKNNVFTIADNSVAKIGTKGYATLEAALAALQQGETLEILQAGEYTVQTLSTPANTTIDAKVDGVVFKHTAAAKSWIASGAEGRTVKNITWNVGVANHQFFHGVDLVNCKVIGLLCTHTNNKYTDCEFYNDAEYNIWDYGTGSTFTRCKFTCPGDTKAAINAYNEGQQGMAVIEIEDCEFVALNQSTKYSAVYIKPETDFDVRFTNCTVNDKFANGEISGSKLWNVKSNTNLNTKVTVDGKLVYANGTVLNITTADQLMAFASAVNGGKSFEGITVSLGADINMTGKAWIPIGNVNDYPGKVFAGVFDGQNHTISNLTCTDNTENYACAALFGGVYGKIKNVTLKDVKISSTHYAGGIGAYCSSSLMDIENCHVIGGTITSSPEMKGTEYDNGDKAGGIIGYAGEAGKITGCTVDGVIIRAYRDLGGIAGASSATISNCVVKNSSIIQDNTNGYKTGIETYHEILGRDLGATLTGNSYENVTVKSEN